MNDPHDHHQTPDAVSERPEPQPTSQTSISELARQTDPSLPRTRTTTQPAKAQGRRPGSIEWVRASDLLMRGGIRAATRGATGQEAVIRRMRGGMASINPVSRRGIARRSASPLPPVASFGSASPAQATTGKTVGQ